MKSLSQKLILFKNLNFLLIILQKNRILLIKLILENSQKNNYFFLIFRISMNYYGIQI